MPSQPVQAATHINYGLARGINGSADIRGYGVVRPLDLRRFTKIVVGKTQTQSRNTQQIENAAQSIVALGIGVPLWKHDHGATSRCWKPPGMNRVVLRMRSGNR